jgi:hypothetical protein
MERFRNAFLLIFICLTALFSQDSWSGDSERYASTDVRGQGFFDCVVGGENAGNEPLCLVEMSMLAALPERYCGKKVWLFGYLDVKTYRMYLNKETAKRRIHHFSIVIKDEKSKLAMDKYRGVTGDQLYASVIARFNCNEKVEREGGSSFGSLSEIQEMSEALGVDRGKGIYSAPY